MKFAPLFLPLIAVAFSACNTTGNSRAQYGPNKASGPYTEARKTGSWRRGEIPNSNTPPTPAPVPATLTPVAPVAAPAI